MEKGKLIGSGRTADVYVWGRERVLKLYHSGMPSSAIEREFTIMRLAGEAGLPVPVADEMVELDGQIGITMERVEGPSMLKILEKRPQEIFSIARLLADLHARMHACSLPIDIFSQRQQIERGIDWAEDLTDAEKKSIGAILACLPEGQAACHGDFHPDNVLMTGRGPIIIDWLTGTRGHPLGDVARTQILFTTGGLPPRISAGTRLLINSLRRLLYSAYLRRYLNLQTVSKSEIDTWKLPLLAARLFEVADYPAEKKLILDRIRSGLGRLRVK